MSKWIELNNGKLLNLDIICNIRKDDKQIVKAHTEKYWSDKPGIFIRIEEV